MQLLLEERAEVNTTDLDGNSALHHAVESCDVEVINILLDCGRINIDIQNKVYIFFPLCYCKINCFISSVIIKIFRKILLLFILINYLNKVTSVSYVRIILG